MYSIDKRLNETNLQILFCCFNNVNVNLQNQQERILINNWRRNACLQQHLFYPNAIYPNAVQYVLPSPPSPPPPPPLASSLSQPAVISSYAHDYQNSTINSIPGVKPFALYGKSSRFIDNPDVIYRNPHEEHTSTIPSSFINTANVVAHQQQPTISQQQLKLSSSLMPLYHTEPFHPLYNNFFIRSHEPQQLSFQETAFIPNRHINKDMTKLHDIGHDESIHDNKSNSIASNSRFPMHSNKTQPYDHHQYYSQAQPLSRTINQYSFGNGSTSSQINVPSNSTLVREFTHLSDQINETKIPINVVSHEQQHSKNKSNTDQSIYGDERKMISNANDIDSMNQYERNTNDKCNEPFKGDINNDVYANDSGYTPTHNESIDLRKSISSTTTASISNVTPSSTTMTTSTDFTLNENAQHIPYSAGKFTFDDVSSERDHYPYEGTSDRTYTSIHSTDLNDNSIDRAHIDDDGTKVAVESISSHTLFPSENKQKITKRRSSIDADSFAKTLGHDINSEKESIAANIRRRYSVAANFLNLPNNAANDTNSFNLTPTITANEYQNNTRTWVNNNNTSTSRRNKIDPEHSVPESIRMHSNGDQSPFDMNSMPRIDKNNRNGSAVIGQNQVDMPMTSTVSHTLPIDSNDGYLRQPNIDPYQGDQNINQYDNDATPYTTATYTMDDQTYVENAMEQLKLDDNSERSSAEGTKPIQFDDSVDRIRASG